LLIFFVAYAWYGMGAGAVAPAWSDMIASCFPVQRRGWFFGLSSFIGVGLGALGAAFSSWLLTAYPFPHNFVYAFTLAAAMISFSWFFIALTRETVRALPKRSPAQTAKPWRKVGQILRADHNFRRFLLARLLTNLSGMGAGFLTISAIERWAVPDSTVGLFTAALLIGQTVGSLAAGLIADRFGHKRSLQLGQVAAILAYALAWLAAEPGAYYLVFALIGCSNGIAIVSGVLIPLEFSQPAHRPTYVGIANTATGIGYTLAPLVGGVLAAASYTGLFAVSAALGCVALTMLSSTVREPRGEQAFAVLDGA
jgi:MFS family permease